MKTFELKGTVRTDLGKKATKAIRANGSIPCELYGVGENIHFSATMADLRKLIYTPEIFVVALNIDGKEVKAVMREIQFHPVSDQVLHIDFYQVTEDKPVVMEVPVKLEGHAEGVKQGGKLVISARKLRICGLMENLPDDLTIDITDLKLGKQISAGDLSFENIQIVTHKTALICAIKATRNSAAAAKE